MENHLVRPPARRGRPRTCGRLCGLLAQVFLLAACGAPAIQPAPLPLPRSASPDTSVPETAELYRKGDFLVGDGALRFVGITRYFATESPESTMVVVGLSIPTRGLSFVRAGDRYAAYYSIKISFSSGPTLIRSERPAGEVRVASVEETRRSDEGIIFQRSFKMPPGNYSLSVVAQDSLSTSTGAGVMAISVPRLSEGALSSLLPVFAAVPRSRRDSPLLATINPRATLRYGRDAAVQLYLESYGRGGPVSLVVTSRSAANPGVVLSTDTVAVAADGEVNGALISVAPAGLDLGANHVVATSRDGTPAGEATVVVSIGEDAPVTSFDELWSALRYFATDVELRDLRTATPEKRPSRWAALMRRTDPNQGTPENEALHEYFRRMRVVSARYREDGKRPWETDRGAVLLALGEPDVVTNPVAVDSLGSAHLLTWEYRRHRLLLVFYDETGLGRWRLTTTSSADFQSLLSIAGPCVGCR